MKAISIIKQNNYFALLCLGVLLLFTPLSIKPAMAQTFTSGSTGLDGPYAPVANDTLVLPPNGIFNFTTVNIPSGVTVTFQKNTTNTPVVILGTGNITVAGTIDIRGGNGASSGIAGNGNLSDDGQPGEGGPGGFRGGPDGRRERNHGRPKRPLRI